MSRAAQQLRVDRLLANMGYGSRKEVQSLVRAGLVSLDGEVLDDADIKVAIAPELSQRMRVRGAALDPPPGLVLMMHKPLGVVCSHKEQGELVYGLLPERWRRRDPAISSIGRLDKDTSGLLLMTDDGAYLHRVISPRSHVPKRYHVTLDRPLEAGYAATFSSGELMLDGEDKPLAPAEFEPLTERTAFLTIHEGRYHQVRRMFAAVGNHVLGLHRDRVGALALPDGLAPGAYKVLTQAEADAVLASPTLR